jgi:hypothetical protein
VCSGRGKTFGEQLDLGDAEVDVSRRSAEEADFSDGDRSSWCVLKIDAGELLEFTAHNECLRRAVKPWASRVLGFIS